MNESIRIEDREIPNRGRESLVQSIEVLKHEGSQELVATKAAINRHFNEQMSSGNESKRKNKRLLILECSGMEMILGQLSVLTDKRLNSSNLDMVDVVSHAGNLPTSMDEVSGILITGSPSDVVEKEEKPWIGQTENFVSKALEENIPVMGVCFGIQLHADLMGRNVPKNEGGREMGVWQTSLYMTRKEAQSPLFEGIEFQEAPDGSVVSKVVETIGSHAYHVDPVVAEKMFGYHYTPDGNGYPMVEVDGSFIGVQFHPELSTMDGLTCLEAIVKARADKLRQDGKDPQQILDEIARYKADVARTGGSDNARFLQNFVSMVLKNEDGN